MADIQNSSVHYDVPLTNFSVGWSNPKFIGSLLFPLVEVAKQSDKYSILERGLARVEHDEMGEEDYSREAKFGISDDSYYCKLHGRHNTIQDTTKTNADAGETSYVLEDAYRVQFLKDLLMVSHEQEVATALSTSGNYATGLYENLDTVSGHNFDDSGANGLKILMQYLDAAEIEGGFRPNTMVISPDAWIELQNDSNFKPSLYGNLLSSEQLIANALRIDRVIVAGTNINNAVKGAAPDMARMWGSNKIWLAYAPTAGATRRVPAIGKTFVWNAVPAARQGQVVKRTRDERKGAGADIIDLFFWYDVKITGKDESGKIITGAFLDNVYASL